MQASNPETPPSNEPTIDELFDVMSREPRRLVLQYLREHGTADVAELRAHLAERTTADTAEIDIILYHRTFPKLDDVDIVDYDEHSEQVRYDGHSLATELLEWVGDKERNDR